MSNGWTITDVQKWASACPGRSYVDKGARKLADPKKKSKYGNEKVEVDGVWFDSKKEAARWKELLLLLKVGEIGVLERQVSFDLNVGEKKVARYVADFTYLTKNGEKVVEDVKSSYTRKLPVYRLKKKLMLSIHKIQIKEV